MLLSFRPRAPALWPRVYPFWSGCQDKALDVPKPRHLAVSAERLEHLRHLSKGFLQ